MWAHLASKIDALDDAAVKALCQIYFYRFAFVAASVPLSSANAMACYGD
jgi:hypothetical protein